MEGVSWRIDAGWEPCQVALMRYLQLLLQHLDGCTELLIPDTPVYLLCVLTIFSPPLLPEKRHGLVLGYLVLVYCYHAGTMAV